MDGQVSVVQALAVRVHRDVAHELCHINISVRRGVTVGLHIHNRCQALCPQLVLLGQRHQVSVGGEGIQALQVLGDEGEVRASAEGGCVVEERDDRLVEELEVVLG